MAIEVGKVYDGKVTGLSKFGAFVQLPEGKSGMVHISEVSSNYVNDIREHFGINPPTNHEDLLKKS